MNGVHILTIVGIVLLFIAITFIIMGTLLSGESSQDEDNNIKFGGFIGPIPFGFANTPIGWAIGVVIFLLIVFTPLILNYFR